MSLHQKSPSTLPCDGNRPTDPFPTEQGENKRAAVLHLFGARTASGWQVHLYGNPGVHELTPGKARELARELAEYADVLEGMRP